MPDYKKLLEELKKKSKGSSDKDYIELGEGDNTVRVCPGHPNMDGFFVEVYYHNRKLNSKNVQVICLNYDAAQGVVDFSLDKCKVCKEQTDLRMSKDKADKKVYNEIKPKPRWFANGIDRSTDKLGVLGMGITILKGILGYVTDPEYGDYLDPVEGTDSIINRAGKDMDTEYTVKAKRKPSPIFDDAEQIAKLIGTSAEDTGLYDLTELHKQFEGEADKAYLVWTKGWDALKEDKDDDKKPETPAPPRTGAQLSPVHAVAAALKKTPAPAKAIPKVDPFAGCPELKSRCSTCGDKRFKTPSGNVCKSGHGGVPPLADGVRPLNPSAAWIAQFEPPAAVSEEEELEEVAETPVVPAKAATPARTPAPVATNDELDDLDAILAQHGGK